MTGQVKEQVSESDVHRLQKKVCEFCRKTSMLESLFDKVAVLRAYNFTKEDSDTSVFL